ncbi:hypothetical protein MM326_13885 [Alkalihalobacillus sp. LMS6]|jgi:hypothetical protein|uniref:hypothetical protein n=1 Tax=Alkalihalobacillus sp. LMS6 TaxID=2924034 RepID=UPI0020D06CE0|nr:hypothetical protein [Alkalihalobacillus sp. LMS6]UTR05193.1 hypothetical protein MM326_13885 [Alkalihalobacillus sp. LMS6]
MKNLLKGIVIAGVLVFGVVVVSSNANEVAGPTNVPHSETDIGGPGNIIHPTT